MMTTKKKERGGLIFAFLFDYAVLTLISIGILYGLGWEFIEVFPALALLHLVASFREVNAQLIAGILFFGKFVKEVSPGWEIVPLFSCKLVVEDGKTIQRQFPAEPEQIDKTGNDVPAPGKAFPIRVTHATKEGSKDPLDNRLTSETTAIIRMRVKKGHLKTFYETVGSMEEAIRQIRDTVEGEIKRQFAANTVAETLLAQASINTKLKQKVEALVSDWGVEVVEVEIVEIGFNHTINKSMADVVAAEFLQRATIATAEAQKKKLQLEGEGAADAEERMLEAKARGREAFLAAEAIGYKALARAASTDEGKFVQWMATLQQGLANGNSTFFTGSDIMGAIGSLEALIQKVKGGNK